MEKQKEKVTNDNDRELERLRSEVELLREELSTSIKKEELVIKVPEEVVANEPVETIDKRHTTCNIAGKQSPKVRSIVALNGRIHLVR